MVGGSRGEKVAHLAFFVRAIRLALARVEMLLCTPLPPRRFESWMIRGVGTTSWFLLPISTYAVACQPVSLGRNSHMRDRRVEVGNTYGGQYTPVLRSEVA